MLKKFFITFIVLLFSFLLNNNVFGAFNTPIENVFSDINKDYKYYFELQTLYDKGIIQPEEDGKFNPQKLLNRDEFVGIAEETSCKKCIVPNVDLDFLNKFKTKPFFDVGFNNKYLYCIADAKESNFVLGYDIGTTCENGTQQIGQSPFCTSNNIKREEALAVIMRMGGIMTVEQANKITSGIKNGQNYPSLSKDINPKNIDLSPYSFYPYFKKALEYEVLDYDENGNKKVYKLIEKKGDYLRPNSLITKEDFLKMAFVALKANSCNEEVENNLAIKIKVYDKSCSKLKQEKGLCRDSDLEDPDSIFDFGEEVEGVCELGVDDEKGYMWRFYNINTGSQIIKYGKFIDNYKFLIAGKYRVYLSISDKCGDTGEVYITINIPGDSDKTDLGVLINANPLSGTSPLIVNFKGIINGGIGPFDYLWDFADGSFGNTKNLNHVFTQEGVYNVKLTVTDSDSNSADSTVTIKVNPPECSLDSDNDGINNCDDLCKLIPGTEENKGCPIFLPPVDNPNDGASQCIKNQNKDSFIFGNLSCNACPCEKSIDFRATIRECDTIIPAITSPTQKDIYSRGNLFQIKN